MGLHSCTRGAWSASSSFCELCCAPPSEAISPARAPRTGASAFEPSARAVPTSSADAFGTPAEPSGLNSPTPPFAGSKLTVRSGTAGVDGGAIVVPAAAAEDDTKAPPFHGVPVGMATMVYVGGLKRKRLFVLFDRRSPILSFAVPTSGSDCAFHPMVHTRWPSAAEAWTTLDFLSEANFWSMAFQEPPVMAETPPKEMARTTSSMLPRGGSENRSVSTRSVPRVTGTDGCGLTERTVASTFSGTSLKSKEKGKQPSPLTWFT
mmetsp:Transcript_2735/g.10729  ORF Transcript_2735/g.10729 Transcript_2735/m.10729 type:complete len:263 (-) Transcript_2735:4812-5600(-)